MTTSDPVTVVATFRVAPGRDADFELWAHEITVAAAEFPGHLGASWVRSKGRYQVIYRFADPSLFSDWHESDVRAEFLKKLAPLATLVTDDHLTGLETWFELPNDPGRPAPPRWKMVVVTWIGVFPLLGLLHLWGPNRGRPQLVDPPRAAGHDGAQPGRPDGRFAGRGRRDPVHQRTLDGGGGQRPRGNVHRLSSPSPRHAGSDHLPLQRVRKYRDPQAEVRHPPRQVFPAATRQRGAASRNRRHRGPPASQEQSPIQGISPRHRRGVGATAG